jgi:hypothetical protein
MEKQWKPWLLQGVHDLPPPQHGHKSKCNQSHKQSFINTQRVTAASTQSEPSLDEGAVPIPDEMYVKV